MSGFEIFVSYSRRDEPIVVPVVKLMRLNKDGLIFVDLESISPGDLWREKVDEALASATYVVLFWCEHSKNSLQVQREYEAALAHGKRLVPVLLDETPLPMTLTEHQWIDFTWLATATHPSISRDSIDEAAPADPTPDSHFDEKDELRAVLAESNTSLELLPGIVLVVSEIRSASAARMITVQFGPAGGTIGRAPTNTLVLDDPNRTVSRVHAQVHCRDGNFFIIDRGSNPLRHNGQALGSGQEVALAPGDRLGIGGFELMVQNAQEMHAHGVPVASDDPFADLLAGLGQPTPGATAPLPPFETPRSPFPNSPLVPDPIPARAASPPTGPMHDPFSDLLGAETVAPITPGAPAGSSDLGLGGPAPAAGIDDLFEAARGASQAGPDPVGLPPLADPLQGQEMSDDADPFADLPIGSKPIPPKGDRNLPAANPNDIDGTPPSPPWPSPPPSPGYLGERSTAPRASAPATRKFSIDDTSDSVLLAAFLRGVNTTPQMPMTLTPELMERIGALLRSATEGTLQLLHTREAMKRGVAAEVTMISAQVNNPLKFSPTPEVALAHLLGPGVRGFMDGEKAMRNAFDDLRAHQFGVMVGMRAALAHVLARFMPEELERKFAAKSVLDSLPAAHCNAKLWDQFVTHYAAIAVEAEEDFHHQFGSAFTQAYEEQMNRLEPLDLWGAASQNDPLFAVRDASRPTVQKHTSHASATKLGVESRGDVNPPSALTKKAADYLLEELISRAKRDGLT
ncbi:type VI secretion system-associated FHA domain protein TagH [Variovorax sp. J22R115]|uniref:type VI secretion system-associated FHA domain protein TagH n=1 Tax=Variovorax sp. J22R115 TaxID=3053509 RepID=UPI002574CC11|nr:type VI secretion system-associated FHA domain protein TagH [Variovorax sp. J22R115]MDM0050609.1 type VI secretion system-associated FHA domain protein TagH [Variovorax sp. J22R115]